MRMVRPHLHLSREETKPLAPAHLLRAVKAISTQRNSSQKSTLKQVVSSKFGPSNDSKRPAWNSNASAKPRAKYQPPSSIKPRASKVSTWKPAGVIDKQTNQSSPASSITEKKTNEIEASGILLEDTQSPNIVVNEMVKEHLADELGDHSWDGQCVAKQRDTKTFQGSSKTSTIIDEKNLSGDTSIVTFKKSKDFNLEFPREETLSTFSLPKNIPFETKNIQIQQKSRNRLCDDSEDLSMDFFEDLDNALSNADSDALVLIQARKYKAMFIDQSY